MGSPMAPSQLTLEGQIQGHSDFLYLMLPLNMNRKPCMEGSMTP